ncbi:MAG TPA: glycerophosphodiester phosphodiesterase family protein [Solimonas sp.]|nr:glycerophosphodiester phosphodiesterase family protein [Solimonas sp.]
MKRPSFIASFVIAAGLVAAWQPTAFADPVIARPQPPVSPGIYVSANRGGAAYAPENTMVAFRNAARLGVDNFETGAWLTADGALVLLHDQSLARTTNCRGRVTDYRWAQLQRCDAGWWFTPGQGATLPDSTLPHPARGLGITVPSAKELFAYVAAFRGRYRPTITIELRDDLVPAREANALVPLIQASGIRDRIIVQSFSAAGIDRVKQLDPSIRTVYLTATKPGAEAALDHAIRNGHEIVAPSRKLAEVDVAYVRRAHAGGHPIVPWTVNRRADMLRLMQLNIDGVISDFPGCALQMQSRLASARLMPVEFGMPDAPLCQP